MSVSVGISEGTRAIAAPPGNIIARIAVTSGGTALDVSEWDPGQDTQVPGVLGYGPGVEANQRALRIGGRRAVFVKATAGIPGTKSTVVHTGPGTGTVVATGTPTDAFIYRAKVTKGGALGTAQVRIARDGYTYGPTLDVVGALPASLQGTVDLALATGLWGSGGTLDTKTIIVGAVTATLNAPADAAALVAQLITATLNATLVAGRYLRLSSSATGSSATLDVGTGTGNTLVGFVADPASVSGTDSGIMDPKSGLTLTFSGTFTAGDTYTVTTTAPRMTLANLDAALDALRASGVAFGIVQPVQDPVDGADLREWAAALDAKLAAWHNATVDRIFPTWSMGTPLGATSTTGAGDATNDADIRTALAGYSSLYCAGIAHGDQYLTSTEYGGTMRRSLAISLNEIFAATRYSSDPGNGGLPDPKLPECSALGPDGVSRPRDENFATHKMEEIGLTVAIRQNAAPKIKAGMTPAGQSSKFRFPGVLRMAYAVASAAYARSLTFENVDLGLDGSGAMREPIVVAIEGVYNADFQRLFVAEGHCSAARTVLDRSKRAADDGVYPLTPTWVVQMNGQIREVTGTVSVVSALTIA